MLGRACDGRYSAVCRERCRSITALRNPLRVDGGQRTPRLLPGLHELWIFLNGRAVVMMSGSIGLCGSRVLRTPRHSPNTMPPRHGPNTKPRWPQQPLCWGFFLLYPPVAFTFAFNRRLHCQYMHVEIGSKSQQPQSPRSEPDGQPIESSHLEHRRNLGPKNVAVDRRRLAEIAHRDRHVIEPADHAFRSPMTRHCILHRSHARTRAH